MITEEEKKLIAMREKWADFPIINFWHNTNDAPDEFFEELLATAREEEAGSKLSRTTTRSKGGGFGSATSTYLGHHTGGTELKYPITAKKWGKFWKVLDHQKKKKYGKNAGVVPIEPDRKTGKGGDECLDMVVTKGLDLAIGSKKMGTNAFEKGPFNTTISYEMLDRKCNHCGNEWTTDVEYQNTKPATTCSKCKKQNDFKDIKGPYTNKVNTLLFPVGMVGDGQTVAFVQLQGKEAKTFAKIKPGDTICFRGWLKGQWYDITVPSGGGFKRMHPTGWAYGKSDKRWKTIFAKGGFGAVPLLTLGSRGHDGFIKS
tara:strand:+ start:3809 stop:4753 length:945 start_codon:yes stop_codon:yes gene_type:complete